MVQFIEDTLEVLLGRLTCSNSWAVDGMPALVLSPCGGVLNVLVKHSTIRHLPQGILS